MRGFKPDDQRQPQGGNMGRDAVMAAIARQNQNQQQTAPQAEPPKPESSPMQSLRQIFSGTVFDPRSRQDKREREAGLADGGRVRPRGFVAGPGTGTSDSIKARLSDGEYVLPADTVAAVASMRWMRSRMRHTLRLRSRTKTERASLCLPTLVW